MKKFFPLFFFVLFAITIGLLIFGRQWYDSLLMRIDHDKVVHTDHSVVSSGVRSQVTPQLVLVYQDQEGKTVRALAQPHHYSQFINQQVAHLERAKGDLLQKTEGELHQALGQVFDNMLPRVDRYADWYFAYPTTYKILWEATLSASRHALIPEAMSLTDAISYDVQTYLHQHYENLVLRPEVTHPQLQTQYLKVLHTAHQAYLKTLAQMKSDFQVFVANSTTHINEPSSEDVVVVLDWKSQFNKINMANYEKGPKGAALGATLALGGAGVGKSIAMGMASKGIAAKAVTTTVSKGVFAKLSAPFVSKAALAGTGGAIGSIGGPIGATLGTLGGISIDYLINEGIELTQRENFIKDIQEALFSTQKEWETDMLKSLQQTVTIWIDDTIQLLPHYRREEHE